VVSISFSLTARQKLDGIAAVVGDEVILFSELEAYSTMRISNLGTRSDSADNNKMKLTFLNEIIDGKILLVHGKKDSTVSVTDEDVDQATNNHIAMLLKQNNLTLDSLEAELQRQQGISLAKFKNDARKIIREQLIKQKVQQNYLFNTKITRKDVENFYNEYKDSLPELGESVQLSQLTIDIIASDKIKQNAYDKIVMLKQRLDNGDDFAGLAKKYSESPEASEGGSLGFISKGTLNEIAFEEKAFNLSVGQISEPFETRLGFHLIKVLERRDQQVNIQQIFIGVNPPQDAIESKVKYIDSLRSVCKNQNCFQQAIKKSATSQTIQKNSGSLGWISTLELSDNIKKVVDSLPVGAISQPVITSNSITVYRLDDKVSKRKLTLENDYLTLENKAKDIAAQKKLISLVESWKKNIFIEIRI